MNENWPDQAFKPAANLADAAEMLWIVLANVSGGDWSKQSKDWQEAAARWRDEYFRIIKADSLSSPVQAADIATVMRIADQVEALARKLQSDLHHSDWPQALDMILDAFRALALLQSQPVPPAEGKAR